MYGGIPTPHGPCSYCYSPYHHIKDCPTARQFSNHSYEHMNIQLSRPRNESYCDSYNPGWSNQSNISWQAQAPENYAPQFHELYHQAYPQFNPPHQQWQSSPYCADFEDNWQPSSQVTPSTQSGSGFQAQMLKLMGKINQAVESRGQALTSLSHTLNSHAQAIAMMEVQIKQMANQIEEEELQRQSEANLDGHYVVDESTFYHEQAITTMKNGEVVKTHGEERKEEQIEASQALHRAKGEEVSTEAPSLPTLILETPYEPQASIACDLPKCQESSLLGILEEQKETIKVENFLVYSPHSIPVHDSLSDEKLFKNTQKNLPRNADIWNYLSVGKIYSLWSKRRTDWCFKFKFKGQRALSASRMWIPLAWRIPHILTK
jgi:hypothetical protein